MPTGLNPRREAVPRKRATSRAKILICCALLFPLARPGTAKAEPLISRAIQIDHVTLVSQKSFDAVKAALEADIPRLDDDFFALLQNGEYERARAKFENGPELSIFLERDQSRLLRIAGQSRKVIQYEIGNPLTASKMTRHDLRAGLYAPLRVLLYENEKGNAVFEYDRPSSLFGQFGNEQITAVARQLDQSLERALRRAAD